MNQLKVNLQNTIVTLDKQGWSKRKIARELELNRVTVRRYIQASDSKSPTPQTGSGSSSLCAQWGEQIQLWVQSGLSAKRIYQDLMTEHRKRYTIQRTNLTRSWRGWLVLRCSITSIPVQR